jgi:DNA-binding CsgD family transcriptional regulator
MRLSDTMDSGSEILAVAKLIDSHPEAIPAVLDLLASKGLVLASSPSQPLLTGLTFNLVIAASLCDHPFSVTEMAFVLNRGKVSVARSIQECIRLEILGEAPDCPENYVFMADEAKKHFAGLLVREVELKYRERLLSFLRKRAITEQPAVVLEIAHHLNCLGRIDEAVRVLQAAALAARQMRDLNSARELLGAALALDLHPQTSHKLSIEAAEISRLLGRASESVAILLKHFSDFDEIEDLPIRAQTMLTLAKQLWRCGDLQAAMMYTNAVLQLPLERGSLIRVYAKYYAMFWQILTDPHSGYLPDVETMLEGSTLPEAVAVVHNVQSVLSAKTGRYELATLHASKALSAAEDAGNANVLLSILNNIIYNVGPLGPSSIVDRALARLRAHVPAGSDRSHIFGAKVSTAQLMLLWGNLSAAKRLAREVLRSDIDDHDSNAIASAVLTNVALLVEGNRRDKGDDERLLTLVGASNECFAEIAPVQWEVMATRGSLAMGVREICKNLERNAVASVPFKLEICAAMYGDPVALKLCRRRLVAAEAARADNLATAALNLFDAVVAARTHQVTSASVKRAKWAATVWNSVGWRLHEALALEYACASGRALEIYEQVGAFAEVDRIRGSTRKTRVSRSVALTPRQSKIVELSSLGKSNKEIAHQLGISRKTVENHLAATYQRLGVRSRWQLEQAIQALSPAQQVTPS